MPGPPPRIDRRTYDDLAGQTRTLVQLEFLKKSLEPATPWQPSDDHPDAGSALIGIFAHMAEVIVDRLNRAPEKNFLAFLDLIGTQVRPPRAARVPLTFRLAEGSPADALVPAGTQVAAPPAAGDEEEIVFETEADLVVTRSRLMAVFAHDPGNDRYADLTDAAAGLTGGSFPVFPIPGEEGGGAPARPASERIRYTPVEHSLYLARDDFLLLPGPKMVAVTVALADAPGAAAFRALGIAWEFWTGTGWEGRVPAVSGQGPQYVATFTDPPRPARCSINGLEAGWLRARLLTPLPSGQAAAPTVASLAVSVQISRTTVVPARAFANAVPLDPSRDFLPLGEQPRHNDALYLALPEDSAKPGASLTLHVAVTTPPPVPLKPSATLALTWEVWDGSTWKALAVRESPANAASRGEPPRGPASLTATGTVAATLPDRLARRAVNGEVAHWLRARLTAGDYGGPVVPKVTTQVDKDGRVIGVTVTMEGGYGPPSLASLTVSAMATQSEPPAACFTCNAFTFVDRTAAASTGTPRFSAFTPGAEDHVPGAAATTPTVRPAPTLYLGFDQPFDNRPVTLHLGVAAPGPGELAAAARRAAAQRPAPPRAPAPPRIQWEYGRAEDWRPLGVADGTHTFGESGELRFVGPLDLAARWEFGQRRYWLRARWQDGAFLVPPRLQRLSLNTTWGTQATTLRDEVLGSSTGEADQNFRTAQAPVLLGQRLDVREPELPPVGERATLMALEGDDAVAILHDEAGQPQDIRVRWHAVPDFHASGPRDRHYVIDALTGGIRFGDGRHGLAPPPGRDNIRMALYRTGGGARGNQAPGIITEIKTTVPYVEGALNPEAARGGADQEDLERVKERGPKALRHQDRAVTAQDFEDLAYEASPEVARAQALMPVFAPISSEWLPVWHVPLEEAGDIAVEVTGFAGTLAVSIGGPGRGMPVARGEGPQPLRLAHSVPRAEFAAGDRWRVAIANGGAQAVRTGQVTISYPGGTIEAPLDVPARGDYTPTSTVRQEGRVELVIVPRDHVLRPGPSVSLVTRVREYLLARSAPTLELLVTEPDWVEVTVTAEVVPASLADAPGLRAAAVAALERFLHPLTGGFDHRGWPFGRRPHLSDLYTVVESVPGLRDVRALAVVNRPSLAEIDPRRPGEAVEDDLTVTLLPGDRRERFLIYSGQHVITLVPS